MKIVSVEVHNFRSIENASFLLDEHTLLVGANNCGKSNIIGAICAFYDSPKFDVSTDTPKFSTTDESSWVEISFELKDAEVDLLAKDAGENCIEDNFLKLRRYFRVDPEKDANRKPGVYARVNEELEEKSFLGSGASSVSSGKFGKVTYIPAAANPDEQLKTSGPSPFRSILEDVLTPLLQTSPSFSALNGSVSEFAIEIKNESSEGSYSLQNIQDELNRELSSWGVEFNIEIKGISANDLVKSLFGYELFDQKLDSTVDTTRVGHGLQRHLIYSVLNLSAKQSARRINKGTGFSTDFRLILFEEPEAFLHPPQQLVLAKSLETLASQDGHQVVLSTHSTNFVSRNVENVCSIARLRKRGNVTEIGQVSETELTQIFEDNQRIREILDGESTEQTDLTMEEIRYCLWLNPARCEMFFAEHVLLVEGTTEVALLNYLIDAGKLKAESPSIFVLDCMGKFNIHRFMNILRPLKINHSVIFDVDPGKGKQQRANGLIEDSKNEFTVNIVPVDPDLEYYLGATKPKNISDKPQHLLFQLRNDKIDHSRIDDFCRLVKEAVGTL